MQKLKLCKLHRRLSNKYLQIPFEVIERKQMNLDECIERAKTTTFLVRTGSNILNINYMKSSFHFMMWIIMKKLQSVEVMR